MNELYFSINSSGWKTSRPTAYYLDDICDFMSTAEEFAGREVFLRDFLSPLNAIYRDKYNSITGSSAVEFEETFRIEIPIEICNAGTPAMQWYLEQYHNGEYRETAQDFLNAVYRLKRDGNSIVIIGE